MAQYRAVQGSDVLTERRGSVTHLALDPSAVAWSSSDRPRRRHGVVLASGLEPTARQWKPLTSEQTSSYAIPPKKAATGLDSVSSIDSLPSAPRQSSPHAT